MINDRTILLSFLNSLEARYSDHSQMMFTISDARNLIAHGECYIAFENIIENLYEFDIKLLEDDSNVIKGLAELYNISENIKWLA